LVCIRLWLVVGLLLKIHPVNNVYKRLLL